MSAHGRNHWIKLYVEMNHDPKIGLLTDDLKWRFISVLLLAGELGSDGFLPEIGEMAWTLRTSPDTLAGQMRTLAGRGLVELRINPDGEERWFITKFAERQAPSTNAERQKQWRNRNAPVTTVTKRNAKVTPEAETEAEAEAETEGESGAIAPAPPAPGPAFRPVPEEVQRQKAHKRITEPEPAVTSTAPAALRMLHELTTYWPGEANAPLIVQSLGDAPDRTLLARAVELWRASGNKLTNWLGICDWYHELTRNPDWTPQDRFKANGNGNGYAKSSPPKSVSTPAPGSQPVLW
jgi:hypothetical protein